jgi:hypothetical protein
MSTVIPFPVVARARPVEALPAPVTKTPEQKAAFKAFAEEMRRKYGLARRSSPPPPGLSDAEEIAAIERMIDTALKRMAALGHSKTQLTFWLSARIEEHFAEE